MGWHRATGWLVRIVTVGAVLAGCSGSTSPSLAPDPTGWVRVTSPNLGYSVALPADWRVGPADIPSDTYVLGKPLDPTMLSVTSRPASSPIWTARPDLLPEDIQVDGHPFVVAGMTDPQGNHQLVAVGVVGDGSWVIAILGPPEDVDRAFFREILGTFRFPVQDFQPSASPS